MSYIYNAVRLLLPLSVCHYPTVQLACFTQDDTQSTRCHTFRRQHCLFVALTVGQVYIIWFRCAVTISRNEHLKCCSVSFTFTRWDHKHSKSKKIETLLTHNSFDPDLRPVTHCQLCHDYIQISQAYVNFCICTNLLTGQLL